MRSFVLGLIAALFPSVALAQSVQEVTFAPGNFGTMVSDEVTGNDYDDFTLGAAAGQEMFVELTVAETDGNGTIYFNILPPGSTGEAIYIGSIDGNTMTVDLPEDGVYTIRVYLMGNDEDTGKTVSYNMDLSVQ